MAKNDKNWLVLYTRSRWEKKVNTLLTKQNVTAYCPLVKTNRKWVDRNKLVELPLFNSYVFVYANQLELIKILQTNGVVTYITHCGQPAIIDENEMERIRNIVSSYTDVQTMPLDDLNIGDIVKVKNGPLSEQLGEIKQIQSRYVIMTVKNLNCAITVKINKEELLPA